MAREAIARKDREAEMSGQQSARRESFLPCLGAAGEGVLALYVRMRGHADAVAAEIERRLDAVATPSGAGGHVPPPGRRAAGFGANRALWVLLRMRDLQRWAEADPELRDMKLALLDRALAQREAAARWRAARSVLAANLAATMGDHGSGSAEGREQFKRRLSTPGSPLDRMLYLCSLLNFEAAGEVPPPGVTLRYLRGRFPEYTWEADTARTSHRASGMPARGQGWTPVTPLARWEYLAADLAEHVFLAAAAGEPAWDGRRERPERGAHNAPDKDVHGQEANASVLFPQSGQKANGSGPSADTERVRVYCRFDVDGLDQLPLLPVEGETLLPELFRHAHRKLGAEGLRQVLLLLAACAAGRPGTPQVLDPVAHGAACGASTRRDVRERSRKWAAAVALLGSISVQRVVESSNAPARMQTTRLLTVLGWEERAPGRAGSEDRGAGRTPSDPALPRQSEDVEESKLPVSGRLTVLADGVLWDASGRSLGTRLNSLPAEVLALPPRVHPYALAIAAWAMGQFGNQPGTPVQREAMALLNEAGLDLSGVEARRAEDTLKRDLHRLQELGVLGRWRLLRLSPAATGVRLEPPGRPAWKRMDTDFAARHRAFRAQEEGGSDWAVS